MESRNTEEKDANVDGLEESGVNTENFLTTIVEVPWEYDASKSNDREEELDDIDKILNKTNCLVFRESADLPSKLGSLKIYKWYDIVDESGERLFRIGQTESKSNSDVNGNIGFVVVVHSGRVILNSHGFQRGRKTNLVIENEGETIGKLRNTAMGNFQVNDATDLSPEFNFKKPLCLNLFPETCWCPTSRYSRWLSKFNIFREGEKVVAGRVRTKLWNINSIRGQYLFGIIFEPSAKLSIEEKLLILGSSFAIRHHCHYHTRGLRFPSDKSIVILSVLLFLLLTLHLILYCLI